MPIQNSENNSSIFKEPSYKETSHKNATHENLKFGYKNLSHNFQDTILNIEKEKSWEDPQEAYS